jgi:large conductance mechanosensitive channel
VFKEFKAFILKGNVVDLAVAVVIGAAFSAVVAALVKDLVTPLIAIPGKADFSTLHFTIRHSKFRYGDFLNVLISFVTVSAAVFFLVVKPMNLLLTRRARGEEEPADESVRDCPECMSSIPKAAKRCAFCTAEVTPV